jgi:hypothetical protein
LNGITLGWNGSAASPRAVEPTPLVRKYTASAAIAAATVRNTISHAWLITQSWNALRWQATTAPPTR